MRKKYIVKLKVKEAIEKRTKNLKIQIEIGDIIDYKEQK